MSVRQVTLVRGRMYSWKKIYNYIAGDDSIELKSLGVGFIRFFDVK